MSCDKDRARREIPACAAPATTLSKAMLTSCTRIAATLWITGESRFLGAIHTVCIPVFRSVDRARRVDTGRSMAYNSLIRLPAQPHPRWDLRGFASAQQPSRTSAYLSMPACGGSMGHGPPSISPGEEYPPNRLHRPYGKHFCAAISSGNSRASAAMRDRVPYRPFLAHQRFFADALSI